MKKMFFLLMIVGLAAAPTLSHAQDSTKTKKKMEMRKALKNKWQNATPEEKEKMKEKAKEMKAKYDSLPPEKKAEIKEKMQARKAAQKKP
jgi:predicted Holliday junction resolvase-like endonuclease